AVGRFHLNRGRFDRYRFAYRANYKGDIEDQTVGGVYRHADFFRSLEASVRRANLERAKRQVSEIVTPIRSGGRRTREAGRIITYGNFSSRNRGALFVGYGST